MIEYMAEDNRINNFGIPIRNRSFYEAAFKDGAWINLDAKSTTYTGRLVNYFPKLSLIILNPFIGSVYSSDGARKFELINRDLEIDLVYSDIISKSRTTEEEANNRVKSYNLDAEISRKIQLGQLLRNS